MQTPKVTWGGLSCNCLSFCTQNLLRRTATRVYIIQEGNTHVHSLSTEYNVCFSTQLGLRVPVRVSDATTRVRINAGGGCPVQSRLQSTGSTNSRYFITQYIGPTKPVRGPREGLVFAITKLPRSFAAVTQCPLRCVTTFIGPKELSLYK